jgi:alpha-tubulin suppressor-like RCC1 family protein
MDHIDALEVQQLCSGGWHAYAKTKHGKFYGWGYNRVCDITLLTTLGQSLRKR